MATRELTVKIGDLPEVKALLTSVTALVERVRELHKPTDEEAEFWFDSFTNEPSAHCEPTCTDSTCRGHTVTVQVCQECGYEHEDGDHAVFRPWPCPTFQAVQAVTLDG